MPDNININMKTEDTYKYVDDIAYLVASCSFNKRKGLCNENCADCSYNCSAFVNVPEHVRAAIVKRADQYAHAYSEIDKYNYTVQRERTVGIAILIVLIVLFVGMCSFLMFYHLDISGAFGYTDAKEVFTINQDEAEYDLRVADILYKVKKYLRDVNNDDAINCQDYSILFKMYWDKIYPKDECHIMGTVLYTKVFDCYQKHLFVRVLINGSWVDVEPQGEVGYYILQSYWSSKKWEVLSYYTKYYGDDVWLSTVQ